MLYKLTGIGILGSYTHTFIVGFMIGLLLIKQTTSKEQEKKSQIQCGLCNWEIEIMSIDIVSCFLYASGSVLPVICQNHIEVRWDGNNL